jgi:hypothetical protein
MALAAGPLCRADLSPAALMLVLVASGCGQAAVDAPARSPADPLRVTNGGQPFAMWDGLAARKVAEADCKSRGQRLRTSIYDRYEAGTWVFVEGCA